MIGMPELYARAVVLDHTLSRVVATLRPETMSWSTTLTEPMPFSASFTVPALEWETTAAGEATGKVIDWWPRSSGAVLQPFGNCVRLEAVVDGATLLLGTGVIWDVKAEAPEGRITVTVKDLAARVAASQLLWDSPKQGETRKYGKRIDTWIERLVSYAGVEVPAGSLADPHNCLDGQDVIDDKKVQWNAGANLWELCQGLARKQDGRLGYDRRGRLTIWKRGAGARHLVYAEQIVSATVGVSREGLVNHVVAKVEDSKYERAKKPGQPDKNRDDVRADEKVLKGPFRVEGPMGRAARVLVSQAENPPAKKAQSLAKRELDASFGLVCSLDVEGDWGLVQIPAGDRVLVPSITNSVWTVASVSGAIPGATVSLAMRDTRDEHPQDAFALVSPFDGMGVE